tara:strand:- start:380 stop:1576 length:1197 start_codon:yes stop_codon:yes gene_type:complete
MTYFILSNIHNDLKSNNIELTVNDISNETIFLNKSLSVFLKEMKEEINEYSNSWDTSKKYTNPYEFIHTPIPNYNISVSQYKPISRAFFKILEIYNTFNIIDNSRKSINTFHLAEGPGGFIEATSFIRKNSLDNYYGMTLIDKNNKYIPGWNKAQDFLKKNKNIYIEKGLDDTGNLYNVDNYNYCANKYGNSMDIITGDGGFDFSIDYNRQEGMSIRLIFTQIIYALSMQKKGGCFIIKIFDIFLKPTSQLIYLLSTFYEKLFIIKPNTSRYANSEKYIVCLNFKYTNTKHICKTFSKILNEMNSIDFEKKCITSILNVPLQIHFTINLQEINCILGNQQIENILNTIKIIINKDKKIEKLNSIKSNNIQKCIKWCIKNNVPYNNVDTEHKNIFLKKS